MYAPNAKKALHSSTTSVLMIPKDAIMSDQMASANDVKINMYILAFNVSLRILLCLDAISMMLKQNAMHVKVASNTTNINVF